MKIVGNAFLGSMYAFDQAGGFRASAPRLTPPPVLLDDTPVSFSAVKSQAASSFAVIRAHKPEVHPFWVFDWSYLMSGEVIVCSLVLALAGLLCSAGGIGGGGIYVTVLMVAGRLSPHDAVPLSKAIVFFGSLSSLVLNVRRQLVGSNTGSEKAIIDVSICRLVVPAALAGTLIGVLLNRTASDVTIVLILASFLILMTALVVRTTYSQYLEESTPQVAEEVEAARLGGRGGEAQTEGEVEGEAQPSRDDRDPLEARMNGKASALDRHDCILSCGVLLVVVTSAVARFHAGVCRDEIVASEALHDVASLHGCRHPAVYFLWDYLVRWMRDPSTAASVMKWTLAIPLTICMTATLHNGLKGVNQKVWMWPEVAKYQAMGLFTGAMAGLVGIGGGLIFSPFFIIMGVEPAVAVATSSTCVIFTSSSTTLQYLLTDRIIISLTLVYGLVNLLASYGGTAFVHFLTDKFAARRSYITGIVALGVAVSAVLSLTKLIPS
eukprot:TRINITY_DN67770_c0_g1_i1.p1 TRINITY_DN67770_c0_g1~~TRINITY_DN67770_c0_g1_i1.p1  ORF type:complete len:494 (-),score=93.19 TRINITY_DN67770_c0_g1_i1:71-1552(-)